MKKQKRQAIRAFSNTGKKSIQPLDKMIYIVLVNRCEIRNGEFITQVSKSELVNRCYDSYAKVHTSLARMERLGFINRKDNVKDACCTYIYSIKKIW